MADGQQPLTTAAVENPTLLQLMRAADPALLPEKSDHYFNFYEDLFANERHESLNILEVGVFRGGSTLLFAKYFSHSRILAVDINEPSPEFYEAIVREGLSDRIKIVIVSQSDEVGLRSAIESYFGDEQLDLVIDDASHLYSETRSTFDTVFGRCVKAGGKYIIEDWGCGYWPSWEDGNSDGRHGLPRLIKELVDLVALPDRTLLFRGERVLPVGSHLSSPIKHVVLVNSVAVIVRSEAPMPSPDLVWPDASSSTDSTTVVPRAAEIDTHPLGLRTLLRELPSAAMRASVTRWDGLRSRVFKSG